MSNGQTRRIAVDIDIDGAIAFNRGEQVVIEAVEPNPDRPEYKFIVYSNNLRKRYQLRDADFEAAEQPQYFAPGDAFQQGVIAPVQPGYASAQLPAQGQSPYRPATVKRQMRGDEARILWFSIATGGLGLLVFIGTFLPWISFLGFHGGSGWDAMLHGSFGGGFSLLIRGEGVIFFTGFWSLAVGVAVMVGGVLLFTRRTLGGWIARIAGGIGAACSMLTMATLFMNGLSAGVGLWLFFVFSVGGVIAGSLTMRGFR